MATQLVTETLNVVHCANCGLLFGITADFNRQRREDHAGFFCPKGHSNVYNHETDAERLARELKAQKDATARARADTDQALAHAADYQKQRDHERKRVNGYKGVVARTKRRIAKGTCPCCSAKFQDLEQHMKSNHPKWNPETGAEVIAGKSNA